MHFCLVVVVAGRSLVRRPLLQTQGEAVVAVVVELGVRPTYLVEEVVVAAVAAEEVPHRLRSVEVVAVGEGVQAV